MDNLLLYLYSIWTVIRLVQYSFVYSMSYTMTICLWTHKTTWVIIWCFSSFQSVVVAMVMKWDIANDWESNKDHKSIHTVKKFWYEPKYLGCAWGD